MLALISTILSLLVGVLLIRVFMPELLGVPRDLSVVQLDERVPPFYSNIFRDEDYEQTELLVKDPITNVRGRPGFPNLINLGPHDALGFRNHAVPRVAQVVVIGDSQIYGMNSPVEASVPAVIQTILGEVPTYSMAIGGWSPVQYSALVPVALRLSPQVVVLGVYLGNDALEAFRTVYSHVHWKDWRLHPELAITDDQHIPFPPPEGEQVTLPIGDGKSMVFTPALRYAALRSDLSVIRAGQDICLHALRKSISELSAARVATIVALIPTKERVYEQAIRTYSATIPEDLELVWQAEAAFEARLLKELSPANNLSIVSLLPALSESASRTPNLYPPHWDGHPLPAGYAVMAETLAAEIKQKLSFPPDGAYRTVLGSLERYHVVRNQHCQSFTSARQLEKHGISVTSVQTVEERFLAPCAGPPGFPRPPLTPK
jgi:lysophospholipase L1-like esterase